MSKYINADKLCEDLMSRWKIADEKKEKEIQSIMADIVAPIVAGQPAADVVEVKHGEWKTDREEIAVHYGDEYEVHIPYCSECGWKRSNVYEYLGPGKVKWNFCPECGADMRGKIE